MLGLYLPPVLLPPPQMIISLAVHTAVCPPRAEGALVVLVAVQLFVPGLYLRPVFSALGPLLPPQTIISLPVHTAVCSDRAGALLVLVAVQLLVPGLYLPPVFKIIPGGQQQTLPRQSFRCRSRLPCETLGQRARW